MSGLTGDIGLWLRGWRASLGTVGGGESLETTARELDAGDLVSARHADSRSSLVDTAESLVRAGWSLLACSLSPMPPP